MKTLSLKPYTPNSRYGGESESFYIVVKGIPYHFKLQARHGQGSDAEPDCMSYSVVKSFNLNLARSVRLN